ncbi:hypothetical protein V1264_024417 [Littorina saxatilis]|uniref:Uncharacterized protein n=1 Tax=Littorina saxatilis TaxID=31220 RepID=A0AAN9AMJ7_9CAEN
MACHCPMIDCDNGSYRLQNGKLNFARLIHQVPHESVLFMPTTVQLASASNTQEEPSTSFFFHLQGFVLNTFLMAHQLQRTLSQHKTWDTLDFNTE